MAASITAKNSFKSYIGATDPRRQHDWRPLQNGRFLQRERRLERSRTFTLPDAFRSARQASLDGVHLGGETLAEEQVPNASGKNNLN